MPTLNLDNNSNCFWSIPSGVAGRLADREQPQQAQSEQRHSEGAVIVEGPQV